MMLLRSGDNTHNPYTREMILTKTEETKVATEMYSSHQSFTKIKSASHKPSFISYSGLQGREHPAQHVELAR